MTRNANAKSSYMPLLVRAVRELSEYMHKMRGNGWENMIDVDVAEGALGALARQEAGVAVRRAGDQDVADGRVGHGGRFVCVAVVVHLHATVRLEAGDVLNVDVGGATDPAVGVVEAVVTDAGEDHVACLDRAAEEL